jgi:outer membrane protein assembly factor BamB
MTLAGVAQIVSVNERTVSGHAIDDGKTLWSFDWPGNSNGDANCATAIAAGSNRFLIGKGYGGGSALVEVTSDGTSMTAEAVWESSRVLKTKFTHACVDGEVAYAVSNGSLEAVRIEDGEKLWTQPRGSRFQQGQILLVDDVIIAQAEAGDVVLVAADPGEYRELLRIPAMNSKTWNLPTVAGRHLLVRNDRQAICFLLPSQD